MTKLQTFLNQACQTLGIQIVIPFSLTVCGNIRIDAQALLPQLGGPRGMIVVSRYDDLNGAAAQLDGLGYGYSVLDEPTPEEKFDLESQIEMFTDWGWKTQKTRFRGHV